MASNKLPKYQRKISMCDQSNIPEIYRQKLQYYSSQLSKPRAIPSLIPHSILQSKIIGSGYGLLESNAKLEPVSLERRLPYDTDVVIQILFCGVCRSDWHSILNEWTRSLPLIPGHEITGRIIQLGKSVNRFKLGDQVGVGPYINSCACCTRCIERNEQYCENGASFTYNSQDRTPNSIKPDAELTYGGFSNIITLNEKFVFKIPSNLPLDLSSPLLCAGITTYSPLVKLGAKPGVKVGIAGIGGLAKTPVGSDGSPTFQLVRVKPTRAELTRAGEKV